MQLELWKDGARVSASAVASEFEIITITPQESGIAELHLDIPIIDLQGYWIPDNRAPLARIPWVIEADSAAQRNFPWISFFNTSQENRISVGLDCLYSDVKMVARMNQESCNYQLTIKVVVDKPGRSFRVIVNRRRQPWTRCLQDWREALKLPAVQYPAGAWEPVFCTWYAVHAAVTRDWVEQTAAEAAKLGFGTYIIDDGWCFDDMKRVSPETIGTWYEMIGDWEVSSKKFPDFVEHVKRVQGMGLSYMLWVTPFLIGVKSRLFQQIKDCVFPRYAEGCHTFDTANIEAGKIIIGKLAALMENYPLDGLKIDFLDYVFPNVDAPRSEITRKFIQELTDAVRAPKADALIEFRQSYATVGMLPYGTQFRAGDVPFDFVDNFQRLAQIRVSIGDGAPVHADPVYWHPRETEANISRHMIASLLGVPMLSMDLNTVSEKQKGIIAHWLGLYKRHFDTFTTGKWEIRFGAAGVDWAAVSGEKSRIVILANHHCLSEAAAAGNYVLNLTAEELSLPDAEAYDCLGNRCGAKAVSGGYLQLR